MANFVQTGHEVKAVS